MTNVSRETIQICDADGLQRFADERHAHAARTAAPPGKLRRRDFMDDNPVVPQNPIGHVVSHIRNDLSGRNAERIRAVVPLLTCRIDHACAAALDKANLFAAERVCKDFRDRFVLLTDANTAVFFGDRKAT